MNAKQALAFVEQAGVVLVSARGPAPCLVEAIAGEPVRGSWWGHRKAHTIFQVLEEVYDAREVLVCRLLDGKVTLVHRRLWPALVRLSGTLPRSALAAIREEHTARGSHRVVRTPFPRWVPGAILRRGRRMTREAADALLGPALLRPERGPFRRGRRRLSAGGRRARRS